MRHFRSRLFFLGFALLLPLIAVSTRGLAAPPELPVIFASVPPHKFLVELLAGDAVRVECMVRPGFNPHSYEPLPSQITLLEKAALYFSTGLGIERLYLDKIRSLNPRLRVVDLRAGLELIAEHDHGDAHSEEAGSVEDGKLAADPHIWLSPRRLAAQARRVGAELAKILPGQAEEIAAKARRFEGEMRDLEAELKAQLEPLKSRKFFVYHPAWSYFAADFELEQVAVEHEGKEPSARRFTELVERARAEKVRAVFLQKQYPSASAERLALEIGAKLVLLDELDPDFRAALRAAAQALNDADSK